MSGSMWKIELLGTLCARRRNCTITRFRTQKTGALLAYLAHNGGHPHRREELIDLLWPDEEIESGRNRLRIALSALRHQFDTPEASSHPLLIADRIQVQLNPVAYTTDKAEFETSLKVALRAEGDAERAALLMRAADLYHGDLLPGYEAWLDIVGERRRLADAYLMALRRLIKVLVQARQYDSALDYARRAVNADPLREESHRTLMKLYVTIGRPAAALRQYRELEQLLKAEWNTLPSATSQALVAHLMDSHLGAVAAEIKTPQAVRPGAVAVMASDPFPSSLPPLPGWMPTVPASNLPSPLTPAFGQEESLDQLSEMLNTPDTRLVTLTGLGGCGKTRLAIAMATRLCASFRGAVWFVALASLSDAHLIVDAIVTAMRLPCSDDITPLEQVVEALAREPSLLVLDNFEHLTESGAWIVQTLVERIPTLTCLVTSRQRLNLAGEYECSVLPLSTPLTPGTPERLLEFASVQLFLNRAQAVRPGFQITRANASAVAALCQRLEGLPLAIELAAAWAQTLTPAQILAHLKQRFALLVNRQKNVSARHASLRAALDWSYDLLSPEVQRFFAKLSVFRDGCTLEAAECVCQEPKALEYLTQLRERSLLTAEEADEEMRYVLLETVREYAQEKLTAEESQVAARWHSAYLLRWAEAAAAGLRDQEAPRWLERLSWEHNNLRAALRWLLDTPEDDAKQAGLALSTTLWRFWYVRGHHHEGYDWLASALRRAADAPPALRLKALAAAGNVAYGQGDYAAAQQMFEETLLLQRQIGSERGIARALGSLGNIANDRGEFAVARSLFEESLSLFRQLKDARGIGLTLANLANVLSDQEDYAEARRLCEESLAMFREAGDTENIVLALNNMAEVVMHTQEMSGAHALLQESLALSQALQSKQSLAHSLLGFASLARMQGKERRAAVLLGAAEALRESVAFSLPPKTTPKYERGCAALCASLGQELFSATWAQGRAMTLEQITNYAQEA